MNKRRVMKMLASSVLQICKASHIKIKRAICAVTLM